MTRKKRLFRDCDPCITSGGNSTDLSPYLSRLINNITLDGSATKNVAPDFIVYTLATTGGIAYIKSSNEWVNFQADSPRKVFGLIPAKVRLWSEERAEWSGSINITRDGDICIFPANAQFYAVANKIREIVTSLNTVEDNISQNLDNMRELAVVVTRDGKLAEQLTALNALRQAGTTALGVITLKNNVNGEQAAINALVNNDEAQEALSVVTLSPNCHNYLADYLELKKDYREELNNVIGVTEVAEKTERRINSEMELIENSSYAVIDLLIDSINKYAKFYNVDILAHRAHGGCAEHADEAAPEEGTESKIDGSEPDGEEGKE